MAKFSVAIKKNEGTTGRTIFLRNHRDGSECFWGCGGGKPGPSQLREAQDHLETVDLRVLSLKPKTWVSLLTHSL